MLVFDGAEVPSNRILLENTNVKAMGISFWRLKKRGLPKTKQYLLSERFPEDVDIFLDSGSLQAKEAGLSENELLDYAADYQDFVVHNADRLSGATEFSSEILGPRWVSEQRSAFWMEIPEIFWPVWTSGMGHHQLHTLSEQYENVAIPYNSIEEDTSLSGRVNAFTSQFQTSFHALSLAKPDNLRSIRFDTASTLSWMSPMLRGETIVWDGMRLVRYPKRMKDQARSRYRGVATSAGLDFDKILADDPQEVTKLAIWSYLQLDKKLRPNHLRLADEDLLVDNSGFQQEGTFVETPPDDVDNKGQEVRKLEVVRTPSNEVSQSSNKAVPREPGERADLPVFQVSRKTVIEYDDAGRPVLQEVSVLESGSKSLRNCNTCFVASNCPAYKKDSECAFGLPVEVKTKEQLKALLNAIIEMQGQRVAFARFSEELNGGYPDPNLSQEIDRLFKLVKGLKELEDNREFIKMTVERRGAGGVLSALFGDRAQSLGDLPGGGLDANQTNRIIDGALDS
jgi:hypothetical protein